MGKYINEMGSQVEKLSAEQLRDIEDDCRCVTEHGVLEVPISRWERAQRFEFEIWRGLPGRREDHNREHMQRFEAYGAIAGRKFRRAIEIGCGPFTNMALVRCRASIDEVHLLDPLADRYRNLPNCAYADGALDGRPVSIHAEAIEACTLREFDLLVSINVLAHCRSFGEATACINDMLVDGGVLVFADRIYDANEADPRVLYDSGHPLRVREGAMDAFLSRYTPLFDKRVKWPPHGHWRYFIGEKR